MNAQRNATAPKAVSTPKKPRKQTRLYLAVGQRWDADAATGQREIIAFPPNDPWEERKVRYRTVDGPTTIVSIRAFRQWVRRNGAKARPRQRP